MADIKSPRLLYAKGILFLVLGVAASSLLLVEVPTVRIAVLLAIAVWSFCRAYYFAFYVVQHYVDDEFRFAGLFDFFLYAWRKRLGKK
jgi:hypothetical protein